LIQLWNSFHRLLGSRIDPHGFPTGSDYTLVFVRESFRRCAERSSSRLEPAVRLFFSPGCVELGEPSCRGLRVGSTTCFPHPCSSSCKRLGLCPLFSITEPFPQALFFPPVSIPPCAHILENTVFFIFFPSPPTFIVDLLPRLIKDSMASVLFFFLFCPMRLFPPRASGVSGLLDPFASSRDFPFQEFFFCRLLMCTRERLHCTKRYRPPMPFLFLHSTLIISRYHHVFNDHCFFSSLSDSSFPGPPIKSRKSTFKCFFLVPYLQE